MRLVVQFSGWGVLVPFTEEAGLRRFHATAWTYLFGMIKSLSSSTTTTVPPRQKRRLKRQQREEEEEFRVHDPKISHP